MGLFPSDDQQGQRELLSSVSFFGRMTDGGRGKRAISTGHPDRYETPRRPNNESVTTKGQQTK